MSHLATCLFLTSVLAGLAACSGPTGDSSAGSSSTSSGSPGNGGPYCSRAEDCRNIACECESGAPVNTRACNNHVCASPSAACPHSCESFGTTWTGGYSFPASSSPSPAAQMPMCSGFFANNACGQCGTNNCCAQGGACNHASCLAIIACAASCQRNGGTESACNQTCADDHPDGASDYYAYDSCMAGECYAACH